MFVRKILRLVGPDAEDFLQGLVTNDVRKLVDGLVYAALLTPQGKYIADFFLLRDEEGILLDVAEPLADDLLRRLSMYKLRANVSIEPTDIGVRRGTGPAPQGALRDPRHPALGWRLYASGVSGDDGTLWDEIRVANVIPESGIELTGDTYILEAGFEALNGIDFRKGCYVGQEVTARMKHKTELRKGLRQVMVEGDAGMGDEITGEGKTIGTLFTRFGDRAIAYVRLDRATETMRSGDAVLRLA